MSAEIIHLGLIEKAKYIGQILPAIKKCRQELGVYELPLEAFSEQELALASDIQKLIQFVGEMDQRVTEFYNRAELSDIDFDSTLYEAIRVHNRWEKRNPSTPLSYAQNKLREARYEKERIEKQITLWEQKETEFTADSTTK